MTVCDAAAYILEQSGEMTAMKLQKLVYYSQCWSLVWDETPLFDEAIEAWANGPVSPDLYACHRGKFKVGPGAIQGNPANLNESQKATIDEVMRFYGAKSAQWLSDLTHLEAPWQQARARAGVADGQNCQEQITLSDMHEYYSGLGSEPEKAQMGRREARIARKVEKQIKENEKKARFVEAVKADSTPRILVEPDDSKSVRVAASPESIMQMKMSFKLFDYADRDGGWSWGQERNWCSTEAKEGAGCAIRLAMNDMSQLTWAEILAQTTGGKKRHKKHHPQSWDSLCNEAQERWMEIDRTEEELFRFRVGGKQRIWGVRQGQVFFVVWWDAEHQIYPTEKG